MKRSAPRPLPPGLIYQPRLIHPEEEQALVARIATLEFAPFQFHQWQGKRRVTWFGWRYDYGDAGLARAAPIPGFLLPLRERAAAFAGLVPAQLQQALVTEYQAGAGIGWHRDRPVFDRVVGISLLTPCTLRLRRRREDGFERAALLLEPGSAYAFEGPARHEWEHSIAPLETLRYSVTFRSLIASAGC